MANSHGDYIWYELITTNADAAQEFYGPLLGWEFKDSGTPGMDYRLVSKNGVEIAGLMTLTQDMLDGGARHLAWYPDDFVTGHPGLSMLRMEVVPDAGGDTLFADMRQVFESLSPVMQSFLQILNTVRLI